MSPKKQAVKNVSGTIRHESCFGEQTEICEVRVYPEDMVLGNVSYGRGETIKIGEFESTKVYISVNMPCLKEEVPFAMEYVTTLVENALQTDIKRIEEEYGLVDK